MSLHPPNYDPRRLFPFGLSPIPEVPSELASEVSSIASSPTPSYEDSDTEVESVRSRSIMYSGSCDSIKSNATIHGKSSSESSTDSEDDATEKIEHMIREASKSNIILLQCNGGNPRAWCMDTSHQFNVSPLSIRKLLPKHQVRRSNQVRAYARSPAVRLSL